MAYFEIRDIGIDNVVIRIRELSELPSAYQEFQIDIAERIGSSYGQWHYFTVRNRDVSFYNDTVGYRTSNITLYGLAPNTLHRIWVYALTNDLYPVYADDGGNYDSFTTERDDIRVPYPNTWLGSISETMIEVMWESIRGADEYDIYLNGNYLITRSSAFDSYRIRDLQPNTWYDVFVTAWVDGVESNQGIIPILEVKTWHIIDAPSLVTATNITNTTATINCYGAKLTPNDMYQIRIGIVDSNDDTDYSYYDDILTYNSSYTINNLLPSTKHRVRIYAYDSINDRVDRSPDTGSNVVDFTTLGKPQPWQWEYDIYRGGPFYAQSGNNVYLMRAAHWNDFTNRINQFRVYKKMSTYSFTTATTSTTEIGIRNCINQAINAINAMGFSQSTVVSGNDVAASIFLTMRNNLNSIL